ncbi:DUF167 domain-containing protein [Actinokineospora globicatena]|uniref:UPF0235 protein Aglo03_17090 n=1 Tax=Actinokineospora globicatena TaxID=103729 RepID=A0A9W6QI60_9PSEU|nr:DUF167 domain-containing protein [Actinokineospora globicatena]MCP2304352.1 hypothetical protein [Actinokineospora globicatena]GLW78284.1 hypothetical protein Aglo01_27660 [Actinokineospora globicatena]GLW85052.1 hypothetical protein Aglo02_26920 [Actinokineospora globicatena]GLW90893.1 hypothetical protein Aglo03_17090 [Actinokineospora globicatena]
MRFGVRVKPGARREAVGGRWGDGDALVVAVAAAAVEGKANEAVRRALAAAFGVRSRDVVIVSGERGRDKVVEIDPAPPDGPAALVRLLAAGS